MCSGQSARGQANDGCRRERPAGHQNWTSAASLKPSSVNRHQARRQRCCQPQSLGPEIWMFYTFVRSPSLLRGPSSLLALPNIGVHVVELSVQLLRNTQGEKRGPARIDPVFLVDGRTLRDPPSLCAVELEAVEEPSEDGHIQLQRSNGEPRHDCDVGFGQRAITGDADARYAEPVLRLCFHTAGHRVRGLDKAIPRCTSPLQSDAMTSMQERCPWPMCS